MTSLFLDYKAKKKRRFVSHTRTHKYVNSLLLYSLMHRAQFLAFSLLVVGKNWPRSGGGGGEKENKIKYNWAKNTLKNFCILHWSFSKEKKMGKKITFLIAFLPNVWKCMSDKPLFLPFFCVSPDLNYGTHRSIHSWHRLR